MNQDDFTAQIARMTITKKGNALYLRRRVPIRFGAVERRAVVWIALNTDSMREAEAKAAQVWETQLQGWDAELAGRSEAASERFEAAHQLARNRGFRWLPVEKVATLPLRDVLDRVEASLSPDGGIDPVRGAAFLGVAKTPVYRISDVLEDYWKLAEDKAQGKSQDQQRRMRNPRLKAFRNFMAVVGDLAVSELAQRDLIDFRSWWWERIKTEDLDPASANKDFTHIASTFRLVDRSLQLGLTLNFTALNFTVLEKRTRLPFSRNWIATKILAPGELDGLNIEARSILLGMINTGYRPSEAQDLLPEHIRLDDAIPHISIEPVGRTLKTRASRRIIPLVGVSLEAFRACPQGFPRYRGSAALSATVNKYLRKNGLLETPDHSMYGLRHSIEDRMLDADVDERIRRDVLGHSLSRERYGKGADLAKLAETLRKVSL